MFKFYKNFQLLLELINLCLSMAANKFSIIFQTLKHVKYYNINAIKFPSKGNNAMNGNF